MLDGSLCSAMESALHPTFPQYLYLDWDSPQTFDTVVLTVRGGPSQAPTSWDLEVSGDGETGWAPAASSGAVQWQGGPGWEEHALHFPAVTGKALRLRVNSANLRHGRYAIHRLSVFLRR